MIILGMQFLNRHSMHSKAFNDKLLFHISHKIYHTQAFIIEVHPFSVRFGHTFYKEVFDLMHCTN